MKVKPTTPKMVAESSSLKVRKRPEVGEDCHPLKKMAEGGMVADEEPSEDEMKGKMSLQPATVARPDKGWGAIIHKAEGGMVEEDPKEEETEDHASVAAAIMSRKAKKMAEGGMVDLIANAKEATNMYDK